MTNAILVEDVCTKSLSDFEFVHDPTDKTSKLGVGSFASVKLAKDKKTGKPYALKMIALNPTKLSSSDLYNIKTEITIHRKLNHPNIIKFHDFIQQDYNVYFILDYAESGNLYSYIHKRKGLPQNDIFRFFYQTCLAVQYLHQNDIMHRDLKPENLLLDRKLNIKVCDFGWSTQRITEKRQTFCGTYEYMAPEIVCKKPYDYRVDIWSLGVLLYELIHQEAPYKGRSHAEITKSMLNAQITFSASIHPEAKDLIQKILKHSPSERLSIAQILSHPWVKSFLPQETCGDEPTSREKSSSRVLRTTPAQTQSISIDTSRRRRDKENHKSEVLVIGENGVFTQIMSPTIRKRSPINLFGSFSGISSLSKNGAPLLRPRDNDKVKEREATKDQTISTGMDSTTLSQSDAQRKKQSLESCSSIPPKLTEGSLISSKGHIKSSMSVSSNVLNKMVQQEGGKTPMHRTKNSKIFENSVLSPGSPQLKTKINDIIHHLSSHTTRNKLSYDGSTFLGTRTLSQQSSRSGQGPKSSSRVKKIQEHPVKEDAEAPASRGKSEHKVEKVEDNGQPSTSCSSSNTSKARNDSANKKKSGQSHAKVNVQPRINLLKNEDLHTVPSPVPKTTRAIKPSIDLRSPEPTDYKVNLLNSINKLATARNLRSPSISTTDRVLSSRNQMIRTKTEENQETCSYNNFFKTININKKKGSDFCTELNIANKKAPVLKDLKELRKPSKDVPREKENQVVIQRIHIKTRIV